jgi:hypothetical protein
MPPIMARLPSFPQGGFRKGCFPARGCPPFSKMNPAFLAA